jgi:hypothetical protein
MLHVTATRLNHGVESWGILKVSALASGIMEVDPESLCRRIMLHLRRTHHGGKRRQRQALRALCLLRI